MCPALLQEQPVLSAGVRMGGHTTAQGPRLHQGAAASSRARNHYHVWGKAETQSKVSGERRKRRPGCWWDR